jgi:hypothetical protein
MTLIYMHLLPVARVQQWQCPAALLRAYCTRHIPVAALCVTLLLAQWLPCWAANCVYWD